MFTIGFLVLGASSEALACTPAIAEVREVMPSDGAVDVAEASVVRVVWSGGLDGDDATYEWTGPDGSAVAFDVAIVPGGIDGPAADADYAELVPTAPLAAGAHQIRVIRYGEEETTSSFTVAADLDVSTPDAPSASGVSVTETVGEPNDTCGFADSRTVTMTIAPDEAQNSVVHVIRESTGGVVASFAAVELSEVTFVMPLATDAEECFTLVQENAIGDESEPSAAVCAVVAGHEGDGGEDEGAGLGCATAPGGAGAGALLMLAALVRRRRA
jgi:uncharacterized protein (TIGR03382 family)